MVDDNPAVAEMFEKGIIVKMYKNHLGNYTAEAWKYTHRGRIISVEDAPTISQAISDLADNVKAKRRGW